MANKLKPTGAWDVRRRIRIPALRNSADGAALERLLSDLPNLRAVSVEVEEHRVSMVYDASALDFDTINRALVQGGFQPLDTWWTRFKAGCFQYSDTNARENATARPAACCNRPPKQ